MGTGICLGLTPLLAAVARARIHIIAPLVIIVVFLAAFQASGSTGDLIALLSFSVFGWLMKRFGWPRPPLVLGLVLSKIIENYLFISIGAYGLAWTYRPIVLLIAALTIFSVIFGVSQTKQSGSASRLAAGGSNEI